MTTTTIAVAYTAARRHLERAGALLTATPAREIALNAAQVCRDLAIELTHDKPQVDVEAANRAARSDASLLIGSHTKGLVQLARGDHFARVAALAEALAELEGAVAILIDIAPTAKDVAASRAYRLNSARASRVQYEVDLATAEAQAADRTPQRTYHRDALGRFAFVLKPPRPGVRRHR